MRFRLFTLVLAALTVIYPRWIELLGIDPDGGNGIVETAGALLCVTVVVVQGTRLARAIARR